MAFGLLHFVHEEALRWGVSRQLACLSLLVVRQRRGFKSTATTLHSAYLLRSSCVAERPLLTVTRRHVNCVSNSNWSGRALVVQHVTITADQNLAAYFRLMQSAQKLL